MEKSNVIDELRIYRLAPGALAEYLRLAEDVAVPIRGDDYGRLLGFWYGEIGAVNSVFNLWQHDDLNKRQAVRAELEKLEAWRSEYLPFVRPLMQQQVIRLMTAVLPLRPPAGEGHTYEVRIIRCKAGRAQEFAAELAQGPDESFEKQTVGLWTTFAGHLNEVVHICAYRDVHERLQRSLRHPSWQRFMAGPGTLIEEIESSLVIPAKHSPWK